MGAFCVPRRPAAAMPPLPLDSVLSAPAAPGFLALLAEEPAAFQELYVAAFLLLDDEWLRQGAGYMQFNGVLKAALATLAAQLKHSNSSRSGAGRIGSLQQLHAALGLQGLRD
jgi:hypothetical protein